MASLFPVRADALKRELLRIPLESGPYQVVVEQVEVVFREAQESLPEKSVKDIFDRLVYRFTTVCRPKVNQSKKSKKAPALPKKIFARLARHEIPLVVQAIDEIRSRYFPRGVDQQKLIDTFKSNLGICVGLGTEECCAGIVAAHQVWEANLESRKILDFWVNGDEVFSAMEAKFRKLKKRPAKRGALDALEMTRNFFFPQKMTERPTSSKDPSALESKREISEASVVPFEPKEFASAYAGGDKEQMESLNQRAFDRARNTIDQGKGGEIDQDAYERMIDRASYRPTSDRAEPVSRRVEEGQQTELLAVKRSPLDLSLERPSSENPLCILMGDSEVRYGTPSRGGEEEGVVARRCTVYEALAQFTRAKADPDRYDEPLKPTNGIYVPGTQVLFAGPEKGYEKLERPSFCSFFISGAYDLVPEEQTKEKMRTILRIAYADHHDSLIFGSLNDTRRIAQLYKEVLGEPEFNNLFKTVAFCAAGKTTLKHLKEGLRKAPLQEEKQD